MRHGVFSCVSGRNRCKKEQKRDGTAFFGSVNAVDRRSTGVDRLVRPPGASVGLTRPTPEADAPKPTETGRNLLSGAQCRFGQCRFRQTDTRQTDTPKSPARRRHSESASVSVGLGRNRHSKSPLHSDRDRTKSVSGTQCRFGSVGFAKPTLTKSTPSQSTLELATAPNRQKECRFQRCRFRQTDTRETDTRPDRQSTRSNRHSAPKSPLQGRHSA